MTALAPIAQTQSRAGDESAPRPSRWSGVFAITRCVFTLIDSESMPVDLPTPLARDLHVGEGLVGGGVAVRVRSRCGGPARQARRSRHNRGPAKIVRSARPGWSARRFQPFVDPCAVPISISTSRRS